MKLLNVNPNVFSEDPDFFPLYEGLKPSSMGLKKLTRGPNAPVKDKIFLFGSSFKTLRESKILCRTENLDKYYQTKKHYPEVVKYIIDTLCTQNSEYFTLTNTEFGCTVECILTKEKLAFNQNYELIIEKSIVEFKYVDAVDALAMQVGEDLVIHHIPAGQINPLKPEAEKVDSADCIHLCHCNGWDAQWAIGQTFDFIHKKVPRINQIVPNAMRMMMSFIQNSNWCFERIAAISIKTTDILNRHESFKSEWDKPFNPESPLMHLRVERQTITGFRESECFLFTIRTFLYDLDSTTATVPEEVKTKRLQAAIETITAPNPKAYAYEIFMKNQSALLKWLNKN
jgi:hypothetical protein